MGVLLQCQRGQLVEDPLLRPGRCGLHVGGVGQVAAESGGVVVTSFAPAGDAGRPPSVLGCFHEEEGHVLNHGVRRSTPGFAAFQAPDPSPLDGAVLRHLQGVGRRAVRPGVGDLEIDHGQLFPHRLHVRKEGVEGRGLDGGAWILLPHCRQSQLHLGNRGGRPGVVGPELGTQSHSVGCLRAILEAEPTIPVWMVGHHGVGTSGLVHPSVQLWYLRRVVGTV
mmetsp:Transcript_24154/g.81511  ORF Transcript_24154/g.81511 Transcript_24154/m.81511 type:complete len:223 (+) Transcript_24154:1098-1766(+)